MFILPILRRYFIFAAITAASQFEVRISKPGISTCVLNSIKVILILINYIGLAEIHPSHHEGYIDYGQCNILILWHCKNELQNPRDCKAHQLGDWDSFAVSNLTVNFLKTNLKLEKSNWQGNYWGGGGLLPCLAPHSIVPGLASHKSPMGGREEPTLTTAA